VKKEEIFKALRDRTTPHLKKALLLHRYLDYRRWENQKQRSFIVNVIVGIVIAIAFFPLLRLQLMEKTFNRTMDWMIRKEANAILKCSDPFSSNAGCERLKASLSKQIAFIDIDSGTYERWGEPLFIPRNEIARFLRLADRNGARIVALDTMFDYPSPNPGEDAELRRTLRDITERKSKLKIIFPTVQRSTDGKIRKSIFDDLIDKNPNFYRGFPYGSFSRSDRVVRYIRYYDIGKGADGSETVLWTVPVLSAALFTDDFPKLKALEPKLLEDFRAHRARRYRIELSNKTLLDVGNNELFSNRIRFSFLPPAVLNSEGNLFLERMKPDEVDAQQQELRDRVVIIGTSCPDKEGWYRTPVGDMPGMYIIGNAANVLLLNRQVRDTPLWVVLLVDLTVILFACYMFVHCHPAVARTIAMVFGTLLLLPATYYFYLHYGIVIDALFLFVNLLVPIMAMGWYGIHSNVRKFAMGAIRRVFARY
jgi:CHASE2 domain-containing sensor protein